MNDWRIDDRGRRVFAVLPIMRSVDQCAERALRGKAGLLARLEAHGVSNRQAARIIRVSAPGFGAWRRRGLWPDCNRVAQAFALLADLDAGTVRPREVFDVAPGRYAGAGADFAALLAEGLAELDERGFRSGQICGQARIEPRMLAKVRLGHVPPYATGRRLLRYVGMVRGGDVAPAPARVPRRMRVRRRQEWVTPPAYRGLNVEGFLAEVEKRRKERERRGIPPGVFALVTPPA